MLSESESEPSSESASSHVKKVVEKLITHNARPFAAPTLSTSPSTATVFDQLPDLITYKVPASPV